MAGWSCYTKVDQFLMLPLQSMGQSATTFVSQNIGARNVARAKKGAYTALAIAFIIALTGAVILWTFAPPIIAVFNKAPKLLM